MGYLTKKKEKMKTFKRKKGMQMYRVDFLLIRDDPIL